MTTTLNVKTLKKQLMAAIAMVLVAAVALGSSTYAWFSAQNDVTATGMSLQAQGESGIVIKDLDVADAVWATTANSNMTGNPTKLMPTSTYDLTSWWHAKSDLADNARAAQEKDKYEDVSASIENNYVVKRTFGIRSAAQVPVSDKDLAVKEVTVVRASAQSETLDKAVRVGVKIGSDYYIYAPLNTSDFTLTANYTISDAQQTALTLLEKTTANPTTDTFNLTDDTIPAADNTAIQAEVYMWFEGEDAECKSTNITANLDELKVTVVFTTVDPVTE